MTTAIAAPALLAGAAYLNAKLQLHYDITELSAFAAVSAYMAWQTRRDRINVFYILESRALSKSSATTPFLMYQGQHWTYKEFYDTVLIYGTWLKQNCGVEKGEVVAMDFMNSPQFMFVWLGLWSIGATPAFINYNLGGIPLIHSIKTAGARLFIVDEEVSAKVTSDIEQKLAAGEASKEGLAVRSIIFRSDVEAEVMSTQPVRYPDALRSTQDMADLAILISTSGTTGLPKAAIVSWTKMYRSGWIFASTTGLKSRDRYYTCMPLYHATAILSCVSCVLFTGATLVLGHRFSTQAFWQDVRQHKATRFQYVGETCRYLLAAPPQLDPVTGENLDKRHEAKLAFGNGLRPDVWERFKDRFGLETIAEFYGATEGPLALINISSNSWSSGSVGRHGKALTALFDGLGEIALVEVDWTTECPLRYGSKGFCKRVPRGEPGELLMALDPNDTKAKFHGYFGNSKATEGKILRSVFKKGDAYFRTGDVLRWDSEGRWYFVDRIGDTFRWKSENVSTSEVAEVLGMHPKVVEANVYGVSIPHHDGRAGCAALQLFEPLDASGTGAKATMEGFAAHVRSNLPKYANPLFLRVVQSMERTGTNKQTKAKLRDEGVDPANACEGESLWWLKDGTYVPFGGKEWAALQGGGVKL